MTEGKKKRRKPWDRRKHPAIRAHMEIAKKHGLQGHLQMAYKIFWGSVGDWELLDVLSLLIAAEPLPPRLKDHPLTGDWRGWRDLHIEPDWPMKKAARGRAVRFHIGTYTSD